MIYSEIHENVKTVSSQFSENRQSRQKRRELDRKDFDLLKDAGFNLTGVLAEQGGLWKSVRKSTRPICDLLRILAQGDSSVALVSSMHPSVMAYWLANSVVDAPHTKAWQEQRRYCSELSLQGEWWGTITSEPGSGGDVFQTKTTATPQDSGYQISGLKHFGSGAGMMTFMVTSARVPGESEPDIFYMDMRDNPFDGSQGIQMMFSWDGHGMIATQSHSMQFDNYPAIRTASPGNIVKLGQSAGSLITCCFTVVTVGICDIAFETARERLQKRHSSLKAYEQTEWTRIEVEYWLIQQAYEAMLSAIEKDSPTVIRETLLGKTAIAELAESMMTRICKVMGGRTFSRHSPFGFWFQDVRALGFLRPPWVLAYEQLHTMAWDSE